MGTHQKLGLLSLSIRLPQLGRLCDITVSSLNRWSMARFYKNNLFAIRRGCPLSKAGGDEQGQDIAEYAVMLAVILLLVVGTIKLIGTNANSTFSNVASSLQ